MRFLAELVSYIYIAIACLTSLFTFKQGDFVSFANEYDIPEVIPEYQTISTDEKTDWQAQWIWDSFHLTQHNIWMCFAKDVDLDSVPSSLVAHISADSKYWLYINGELVVFEGSVKRDSFGGYYDSVDVAPYLKKGTNTISALVWFWGTNKNYSYNSSGQGGFLFEAIGEGVSILSNSTWKAQRHWAYKKTLLGQPNYRLPEFSVHYDARDDLGDWTREDYDHSSWHNAVEYARGGEGAYGSLYPRGIPMLKDYGLKDYENSLDYTNYTVKKVGGEKITVDIPYNAQFTPYLKVIAPAGKKIRITTENTLITGTVTTTYTTKEGEQEFEALGWMNGEHVTYKIPKGVTVVALKYRETGYDSNFAGDFKTEDEFFNSLWQKSLRTLYVTMRDNFMDCPDRERAQWWGDATSEMLMTMYAMDSNSYLLYQKGVESMLKNVGEDHVLQTVVPISDEMHELPVQQLAGIVGFYTYYEYTGDIAFLERVYDASVRYLKLWEIGEDNLVVHREGTWDWADWGKKADVTTIENAWVYYALSSVEKMAKVLGRADDLHFFRQRKQIIEMGCKSLWTDDGYKSDDVKKPDDRANALAVLSGLANRWQYNTICGVLTTTQNASPYMEYYVLEALCKMGRYQEAKDRIKDRYNDMMHTDYSTLWEFWDSWRGTKNHAWSGGPLVIMSKHFAGITPIIAGCDYIEIKPQYSLFNNMSCTVPSVKGIITFEYEKVDEAYTVRVTLPEEMFAVLSVPRGATVYVNGHVYYINGQNVYGVGQVDVKEI